MSDDMDRALAPAEQQDWLQEQTVPGSHNAVVTARVRGPLEEVELRRALSLLQARHPRLRVREVPGEPPRYASGGVPPIPLTVLPRRGPEQALEVARAELNRLLPAETGPLLRATLLEGPEESDLLLTTQHGDALMTSILIRDLLTYVAQGVTQVESLPPSPPASTLLPPEARGEEGLRQVSRVLEEEDRELAGAWCLGSDRPSPPRERSSRFAMFELSEAEVRALRTRSAREGATLNAAITAAFLLALGQDIRARANPDELRIGLITPVTVRRALKAAPDDLGNFTSTFVSAHRVDPDGALWPVAQDVIDRVLSAMERQEPLWRLREPEVRLQHAEILKMIYGSETFEPRDGPAALISSVEWSAPTRYGPLELLAVHLFVATTAYPFPSALALSFAGRLHFSLSYAEPAFDPARMERIAQDVLRRLRAAAAS